MAAQLGAESTRTKRATANYATDTYSPHVMTGVVDKAHAAGYLGAGQLICALDTGVDYNNPILGGCFGPGSYVAIGYARSAQSPYWPTSKV